MNIELIGKQLVELEGLIEGWSQDNEVSAIERDVALDRVKRLYEELRFGDDVIYGTLPQKREVKEESEDDDIEVEITYYEGEQDEELIDVDDESEPLISISLDDISIVEEPIEEPEPIKKSQTSENSLFDLESIPVRPKSRRSAILSLYSDGVSIPTPEIPTPQSSAAIDHKAQREEMIIEEVDTNLHQSDMPQQNNTIIADILTPTTPTIADMYTSEQSTLGNSTPMDSSINDKFIIVQELFGGNIEAYESFIDELDSIGDFNDCMIYIVENYNWNPNSEAVKAVVKSLETKYL